MVSVRFINRLVLRIFTLSTLSIILFNEVLIYYICQSSWKQINCNFDNCTRILLIADPQLLGRSYDEPFYNPIAIFDSDRYLKKTFEQSLAFTQPHIICFLGDLLDLGNVAAPDEFDSNVQRFRKIYRASDNIRLIHIPGDNDIGGENGAYISNSNVRRFESAFTNEDIFDYDSRIRFFKINRMLLDFTNPDREHNHQRLRIGLSHAPILIGGGPLLRAIINELDPHIIFSGHWHESRIFLHPSTKIMNFYESSVKKFDLKALKDEEHNYLEIMVPTASYRMGKPMMGIGYAVLENYNMRYTVLWQPNRFIYLWIYVFWMLFSLSVFIVFRMMTRCPFRVAKRQSSSQSYARVPAIP